MKDGDKPSLLERLGIGPKPVDPKVTKLSSIILSTNSRRNAKLARMFRGRKPPSGFNRGAIVEVEDRAAWRKRRCGECGRMIFLRRESQYLAQHFGRPNMVGSKRICPSDVPEKETAANGR